MFIIIPDSHLDHDLTLDHVRCVLQHCRERSEFFIESITLPDTLPALPCALRGPAVGTVPILDADVIMRPRSGRAWPSRLIADPHKPIARQRVTSSPLPTAAASATVHTRILTVIGGPSADLPCVLYTMYGGPVAPREVGDPSLPEGDRAAAEAFWGVHALVAPLPGPGGEDQTDPV